MLFGEFTHGFCEVRLFALFLFLILSIYVFKASILLVSDGFILLCPAVLGSSLRSTDICHHIQLEPSHLITNILPPMSILTGWHGSLWKTSHMPRATAAFPTSLLFLSVLFWYPSLRVKQGFQVSCHIPWPLSLLFKHWCFGALQFECRYFSVKVWCLWFLLYFWRKKKYLLYVLLCPSHLPCPF